MFLVVLIVLGLILLNGFFALSEMAIVSARKPLLQEYAKQGKRSAQIALSLKENAGQFLSTVQVGITLIGILAGAYGGAEIAQHLSATFDAIPWINPYGETVAVLLIVTIITYFSVVIGELVPKQIALNNAEWLAMRVARPMYLLCTVCTPVVFFLQGSTRILMKLMRIKPKDRGVTETEIRAVIAEGAASGAIDDDEHALMRRVIRLGERDVKSIMTHRRDVKFIDINDNFERVQQIVSEAGHSRYPVIDSDPGKILGVLRTKQLIANVKSNIDFNVRDFLTPVVSFHEATQCMDALDTFRNQRIHIAAVVDDYGVFEGIFTTSDLLEAIVGFIPSNYDSDEDPHIVQRQDSSWLLDGLTTIDEIHMIIDPDLIPMHKNYQTIAGFLLNQFMVPPKVGAILDYAGYRFEIVDMDKYRIDKILLIKLPS